MNIFTIAWKSVRQRALASGLTAFSMALGVMLVVAVLVIMGVVSEQFRSNASLGYNLLVGAKGGRLQLTLNSVYYLSKPIETVDYRFYLEFLGEDEREPQLRHSYAYWERVARQNTASVDLTGLSNAGLPGFGSLATAAAWQAMDEVEEEELGAERDGNWKELTEFLIPLCLGDYLSEFRVIGTTEDMFGLLPTYMSSVVPITRRTCLGYCRLTWTPTKTARPVLPTDAISITGTKSTVSSKQSSGRKLPSGSN